MEAEVDKLELMFQKADSDLDYIQYRLEYEIKTNHPDTAGKLSPLTKEEKTAAEQLKSFVQTYEEVDLQKEILMERRSIPERFKKMSC
ncbi:spindle and kinetochore-associated protein 2 isoform X4 [Panthera tigris]|uniref:spindle and kinetochore-associated protein 2 isoform X4 n=1 Tax=Panthera tigris TaxID=9694 RepID=UPI001C6FB66E|nr:spindle and kinetochore-associated protein 2 isoform X4 [Panthera tigris]